MALRTGEGRFPILRRSVACRAIVEALSGARVSDQIRQPSAHNLIPVTRHWHTKCAGGGAACDHDPVCAVVGRDDERRVKPELRAALSAAAYQLLWLDRIPGVRRGGRSGGVRRKARGRAGGWRMRCCDAGARSMPRAVERGTPRRRRLGTGGRVPRGRLPAERSATRSVAAPRRVGERIERMRELAKRQRRGGRIGCVASQATPATVLIAMRCGATGLVSHARRRFGADEADSVRHGDDARISGGREPGELAAGGRAHVQDSTRTRRLRAGRDRASGLICARRGSRSARSRCKTAARSWRGLGDRAVEAGGGKRGTMGLSRIRTQRIELDDAAAWHVRRGCGCCSNSGVTRVGRRRFRLRAVDSRAGGRAIALLRAARVRGRRAGGLQQCSIEPGERGWYDFARAPGWRPVHRADAAGGGDRGDYATAGSSRSCDGEPIRSGRDCRICYLRRWRRYDGVVTRGGSCFVAIG